MFKLKKIFATTLVLSLLVSAVTVVHAASTSWSYSNYNYGSYVPKSGSAESTFSTDTAKTQIDFSFDSNNVNSIIEYNNGNNSSYQGTKGYVTVDVTSVRTGTLDMMHAYAMVSNLPDPKFDMENDDIFGDRNEESEVVALGTVEADDYYVKTTWEDFRSGGDKDNGKWQCQFSMSKKGISDYNTFVQSSAIQATLNYGKYAGQN
nr:hypothetical protein [Sedimentibacter sp.]